jgi:hypothetical protein
MTIQRSRMAGLLTALCLVATGMFVPAALPPGPALAWGSKW